MPPLGNKKNVTLGGKLPGYAEWENHHSQKVSSIEKKKPYRIIKGACQVHITNMPTTRVGRSTTN